MTEISDDKADERRIIIHKRQNKNIKVCRQSRADLNNSKDIFDGFIQRTIKLFHFSHLLTSSLQLPVIMSVEYIIQLRIV